MNSTTGIKIAEIPNTVPRFKMLPENLRLTFLFVRDGKTVTQPASDNLHGDSVETVCYWENNVPPKRCAITETQQKVKRMLQIRHLYLVGLKTHICSELGGVIIQELLYLAPLWSDSIDIRLATNLHGAILDPRLTAYLDQRRPVVWIQPEHRRGGTMQEITYGDPTIAVYPVNARPIVVLPGHEGRASRLNEELALHPEKFIPDIAEARYTHLE